MTIRDLSDFKEKNDWLKITDEENIFSVYLDDNGNYIYNLNSGIYFDVSEEHLEKYICDYDMFWPLISYKLYSTTRLAWFLMKINKVQGKDIFKKKLCGDVIYYIPYSSVKGIISKINAQ